MRSIVANPKFALSLGEEARKRIEQKFSEDLMVENTMKIYDELLRQNATK